MNATDTAFDTFASNAAFEVTRFRNMCHVGTPQAPRIEEVEAIIGGKSLAGLLIAAIDKDCTYCGTQVLPLADSTTGYRPFPHNTKSGDLCVYGTKIDALTNEATRLLV